MPSFLLPWRVVTISLFLNAVTTVTLAVDTAVVSLLEKLQEQHNAVADPLASPEIETIFFSSQNTSPTATSMLSSLLTTPPTDIATSDVTSSAVVADPLFSSQNVSCQDSNEMEVIILINSDNYPTEITWTLTNLCDSISTSGGPYSSIRSDDGRVFQQCIPKDRYEFIILDSNNDGICCEYGNGSYSIVVNGVEVHSGNGEYGSNDTAIIGDSCADNKEEEEIPTLSPTAKDTITEAPTTTSSSSSSIEESALQPSDPLSEAATTTTTSSTPVSLSISISMSMATLSPTASSTTTSSASSSLTSTTTTASPTNPSEEETGSVVPITTMPSSLSPSSTISTSTTMTTTTTTLPIPELKSITTPKPYTSSKSSSGFMFDTRTPSSSPTLILYGIEIDMVDSSMILTTSNKSIRVEVYYRNDNDYHTNHEYEDPTIIVNDGTTTSTGDSSSSGGGGGGWILWMNVTIVSSGLDLPTYIPQQQQQQQSSIITTATNGNDTEEYIGDNIILTPRTKMGFYIRTNDGPYLRYYHDTSTITSTNNARASYYNDGNIALFTMGTAKRSEWDGTTFYPRTFLGGLHYYESDVPWTSGSEDAVLLPGVGLVTSSPTMVPTSSTEQPTLRPLSEEPTFRPSISVGPTVTIVPTLSPTNRPTMAPIAFNYLSTQFETAKVRSYAGNMFNIKARSSIEISSLGIHTFLTSELNITIYILDGGYSIDTKFDNSANWTMIGANVTVLGIGIGKPTYIPYGSFEPIVLQRKAMLGIYITSDGPYLLSTMGTLEGKPHIANPSLVLYEGCGVRYPYKSLADGGNTFTPRIGNIVIGYSAYIAPTMAPTMDIVPNLFIGNATFVSDADTYIQKGSGGGDSNETFGYNKQLMVDGSPTRVTLIHFDLSSLNQGIMNNNRAGQYQIVNATLRLYSMDAKAMSGGQVSIIANGVIDEESTTWETSTYGDAEMGIYAGSFRAVWPDKYYEVDVTTVLRSVIGSITSAGDIVIRIGSDESKMVNYRSREDAGDKAPALLVTVAYDADMNKPLARTFGSDPPTMTPTIVQVWEDAEVPSDPSDRYFNYDINSEFGPEYWYNAEQDGYYDELRRLEADLDRNRCNDGSAQSPRDLCDTNAECIEFHMPRPRVGMYGLRNESTYRPTPMIMHNKLRLRYPERRSEEEKPEPPGTDFANNVFQSGIQDLVHIDIHVKSEHRLCGKQYDGEMQLFHVHHQEGNLEVLSILIEAGGDTPGEMGYDDNPHFQVLLDYFQMKFDEDAGLCQRRRRMAEGHEDAGDSSPSLIGSLYRLVHDKYKSIADQRRLAKLDKWDPMLPWFIYRTVHFWGYSGSITEPPCFQGVNWRVLDVPMRISMRQLFQLKRIMFDHVDPDTCLKTSTHYEESNARPVKEWNEGGVYRCRRSDYASDMERLASGRRKGFVDESKWWGVDNFPYVSPEFPEAGTT